MKKIILASSSPRRKELLTQLGLEFTVIPSDYHEDLTIQLEPIALVQHFSLKKAEDVARKNPQNLIIAADTIVVCGKRILGKPGTAQKAKKMLQEISGKNVMVITGVTVIDSETNRTFTQAVETIVSIKELSETEIENYVATGEPLDKAGAFGIQGLGSDIVVRIEGDYSNVVGLPVDALTEMLHECGINTGEKSNSLVKRVFLVSVGSIAVVLGMAGIFLPLLPTTPFLLLAAACFIRSSDALYQWLITHKWFGEYIRNYHEHRAIPKRAKIITLIMLWAAIGYSAFGVVTVFWLRILLLTIACCVTLHVLSLNTLPSQKDI